MHRTGILISQKRENQQSLDCWNVYCLEYSQNANWIPLWSSGQDSALSLPWSPGSVPGGGIKILQASWHGQKNKKEKSHSYQETKIQYD